MTKRNGFVLWGLMGLTAAILSGCGGGLPSDPASNVPELAGYWKVTDDNGTGQGYIHFDNTGDPLEIRSNPDAYAVFKEKALALDGQKHTTAAGYDYAATGRSTKNGSTVTVTIEIVIYASGIQAGTSTMTLWGTFTNADTIQGNINVTQQVSGAPAELTKGGKAVRVTASAYAASEPSAVVDWGTIFAQNLQTYTHTLDNISRSSFITAQRQLNGLLSGP